MAMNQSQHSILSDKNIMSDKKENNDTPCSVQLTKKRKLETRYQDATMTSDDNLTIQIENFGGNQNGNMSHKKESSCNRVPFTVLQSVNVPINRPRQMSKSLNEVAPLKVMPNQIKKLKMRISWEQFREFSLTQTISPASPLPKLNWADRQEMWDSMCKKESGMYLRKSSQEILKEHPALESKMRSILLDWLVEVCDVYKQHRETYYLSVDYFDRYLSLSEDVPKNCLQLIGITCLFIASKIEEVYPPNLSDFAYVTDGTSSEKEILQTELIILKKLNWGLAPMTPNAWMRMFMQLTSNVQLVTPSFPGVPFCKAMQLMDFVILDIGSLDFKYSVLAAAVLFLLSDNRQKALETSGYSWQSIKDCVAWMTPFYQVLSKQPSFNQISINFENQQHNFQCHRLELSVFDHVQDLIKSKTILTPSVTQMTPPKMDTDLTYPSPLFTKQALNEAPVSVFMSPQSPKV